MDQPSSSSQRMSLVDIKKSLETASNNVKTDVLHILQRFCVNPKTTAENAIYDLTKLSKDCLTEIEALLHLREVSEWRRPEKRVTIAADEGGSLVKKTPRELETVDLSDQMSPVQSAVCKKIKECTKNLIKHKRVYVDRDYGIDDGDDEVDVGIEDIELQTGEYDEPEAQQEEDPPQVAEDETQADGEDDITCEDELTNAHEGESTNDDQTVTCNLPEQDEDAFSAIDPDEATHIEGLGNDIGHDDTVTIVEDEQSHFDDDGTPMARVHFGDLVTVTERFTHYRNLLASSMELGDCSELGLGGLHY